MIVISSTFGGKTLGLAAARAVLDIYATENVIGTILGRGEQLHVGFAHLCAEHDIDGRFSGLAPQGGLQLPLPELQMAFDGECLRRGVITYSLFYPSYSHTTADIDEALDRIGGALSNLVADRDR